MNEVFQEIQKHFMPAASSPNYRSCLRELLRAVETWTNDPNTNNTYKLAAVAKRVRKEVGDAE